MRRWFTNLALASAAIACIAAVLLWPRAQLRADIVGVVLPGHVYVELSSVDGSLQLQTVSRWPTPPSAFWSTGPASNVTDVSDPLVGPMMDPPPPGSQRLHGGFGLWAGDAKFLHDGGGGAPDTTLERRAIYGFIGGPPTTAALPSLIVTMPPWTPAALATLVVAVGSTIVGRRRLLHRRRRRSGLCPACGYDCRHAPGPCPECGSERPGRLRFRGPTDDLLAGRPPPRGR